MADDDDKKISALDPASALDGTEMFVVVQGGVTKKVSLFDALASVGIVVDPDTGRIGFGVDSVADLRPGRLTIAPSQAGLGDELVTNGSFTGNANGWTLGSGWAYGADKVTYTPGAMFTELRGQIETVQYTAYRVTGTISGATGSWSLTVQLLDNVTTILTSNGAFSVDLLVASDAEGFIAFFSTDNTFNGSVDDVSVKTILATTALTLLYENGEIACTYETAPGGGGEPSAVRITASDDYSVQPGSSFILKQNPHDGGFETTIDHYSATEERAVLLPDLDGTVAFRSEEITFAQLPASAPQRYPGLHAVIVDSSTETWGATVTGGGAFRVIAVYNGFDWKVMGK